ncbi:unnamed protein product [Linum trigynum]|uniref:Uncharacterized protein n=1 Tax=Linum trigynum TaxID=586398 RepID=A0AAV2ERW6_9ROSI
MLCGAILSIHWRGIWLCWKKTLFLVGKLIGDCVDDFWPRWWQKKWWRWAVGERPGRHPQPALPSPPSENSTRENNRKRKRHKNDDSLAIRRDLDHGKTSRAFSGKRGKVIKKIGWRFTLPQLEEEGKGNTEDWSWSAALVDVCALVIDDGVRFRDKTIPCFSLRVTKIGIVGTASLFVRR